RVINAATGTTSNGSSPETNGARVMPNGPVAPRPRGTPTTTAIPTDIRPTGLKSGSSPFLYGDSSWGTILRTFRTMSRSATTVITQARRKIAANAITDVIRPYRSVSIAIVPTTMAMTTQKLRLGARFEIRLPIVVREMEEE